jgi:hypothetical protein
MSNRIVLGSVKSTVKFLGTRTTITLTIEKMIFL